MIWKEVLKKDKDDMRVGTVYPSDRSGKKIMMLTHEGKIMNQIKFIAIMFLIFGIIMMTI